MKSEREISSRGMRSLDTLSILSSFRHCFKALNSGTETSKRDPDCCSPLIVLSKDASAVWAPSRVSYGSVQSYLQNHVSFTALLAPALSTSCVLLFVTSPLSGPRSGAGSWRGTTTHTNLSPNLSLPRVANKPALKVMKGWIRVEYER